MRTRTGFKIGYFRENEKVLKIVLACVHVVLKNRGRKSRDTLPFKLLFGTIWPTSCVYHIGGALLYLWILKSVRRVKCLYRREYYRALWRSSLQRTILYSVQYTVIEQVRWTLVPGNCCLNFAMHFNWLRSSWRCWMMTLRVFCIDCPFSSRSWDSHC